jgi:hypothetical protein
MAPSLCDYCRRALPTDAVECDHCGAKPPRRGPLSAAGLPDLARNLLADVSRDQLEHEADRLWPALAAKVLEKPLHWAAGAVGVLLTSILSLAAGCHVLLPHPAAGSDPVALLPMSLRIAASCSVYDTGRHTERCVIPAGSPLLMGIDGGGDVSFYVESAAREQLSTAISQWRAGGGTVIADNAVFLAISPAHNVLYANTRSGLRVDTDTFADSQSAQAFVDRTRLAG